MASFRSMPAENDFSPAAVRMASHGFGSALKSANAASIARSSSAVNAFIASGRLMVMIAMRSRFSYCIVGGIVVAGFTASLLSVQTAEGRQRHLLRHVLERHGDGHADLERVGRA